MSASEKIVLIGWGAIGQRVAELLAERKSSAKIVAVAVRDKTIARDGLPAEAILIEDPAELGLIHASLAIEAAGRASVLPWGEAALSAGMDFVVSSTSSFVDDAIFQRLNKTATRNGTKLIIPPGALGGVDALSAASRLSMQSVEHRIIKPAKAWAGTLASQLLKLDQISEATVFFKGSARDAADAFPQNANVAVITSLAGIGLDRTLVTLIADPTAHLNTHEIIAEGDFGKMHLRFENSPLSTNPKSSEMTALNLARTIENRVETTVI
ncbi:aspartate dehydrogenase [Ochrobactrum sp. MYb379]|uniref:aspartate dehydrogenase n=1 Tax=Ochrobactrum sp. MYb379 TaxID=2745275 RepID=UPI0030ACF6DF